MQEEKEQLGSCCGPHGFKPRFLHSPLYRSHLALLSPSFLVLLLLSLPFSLVFLALAGHAAAAQLFGSLGFMVAALPLCNDGLVNSNLHWCGETFPHNSPAASDT